MKVSVLFCFLLALAVSVQAIARESDLIVTKEPFSTGATVEAEKTILDTPDHLTRVEKGVVNGVAYTVYYFDGSGTFIGTEGNVGDFREPVDSNWYVECKKDPISDKKMCSMHMKDIWLYAYPNGKTVVSVGRDHFPSSTTTIRIDAGQPFTANANEDGDFPAATSSKIIAKLKIGKTITTRFMRWPYRNWVDTTWDLYGFNEAYSYINWAVKRIK